MSSEGRLLLFLTKIILSNFLIKALSGPSYKRITAVKYDSNGVPYTVSGIH